jgi:hypothetical protein
VGNEKFIGPFIGVDFGGPKVESFCKKVQNFKKFIIWGVRVPGIENDHFLNILDPPMGAIINQFLTMVFSEILTHF